MMHSKSMQQPRNSEPQADQRRIAFRPWVINDVLSGCTELMIDVKSGYRMILSR